MPNYRIELCGVERSLPIVEVSPGVRIASFDILGDAELVRRAAPELLLKLPAFDILAGVEAKSIPLIYEMARLVGHDRYIVARKTVKPYMNRPVLREAVESITTPGVQHLVLDAESCGRLFNKRVVLVDDVVSTGASLRALESLVVRSGGHVVAKACLLAEGSAAERDDLVFLGHLPLFAGDAG